MLDSSKLIDAVLEVRDARLSAATSVVELHRGLREKPLFVLLNKSDLASPAITKAWLAELAGKGIPAFSGVGTRAESLRGLRAALLGGKRKRARIRVAVVGAPNTGKSSVINALLRRKRVVAQNKPGVTRSVSWRPLDHLADLLDTPGVLEPRITSGTTAWQLAICGILPDSAFDMESVARQFIAWVGGQSTEPSSAKLRSLAELYGRQRNSSEDDDLAAARRVVMDFRKGRLGRITFEQPADRR